jgi:hypothetical protein
MSEERCTCARAHSRLMIVAIFIDRTVSTRLLLSYEFIYILSIICKTVDTECCMLVGTSGRACVDIHPFRIVCIGMTCLDVDRTCEHVPMSVEEDARAWRLRALASAGTRTPTTHDAAPQVIIVDSLCALVTRTCARGGRCIRTTREYA